MTVQYVDTANVRIAYESFGNPQDPTIVLVMGLGAQMIAWYDGFVESIAAEGFHVVRFDNRDSGLSTHLHDAGTPGMLEFMQRQPITSFAYTLAEMADDVAGLLDGLDIAQAHIVGASMGGMITQEFAIRHPERTLSVTSIFSTPAPWIGSPSPEAMAALMAPPADNEADAADRSVELYKIVGSPGFELDEAGIRESSAESFRRANDPAGTNRQLIAIQVSPDRTEALAKVTVPTVVIHGLADPLVKVAGGEATAAAIPGAKLVTFEGMGHDLPKALWPAIVTEITEVARAGSNP